MQALYLTYNIRNVYFYDWAVVPNDEKRFGDSGNLHQQEVYDMHTDKKFRLYRPLKGITHTFGDEWFALKAEAFARFFGTPIFLIGQTIAVIVWIVLNVAGVVKFDPYPFILLNLAFSIQAAYAAPLILLAQTRQAERDQAHALADAQHREDLDDAMTKRQILAEEQSAQLLELLKQNTQLTEMTREMAERIETITLQLAQRELHKQQP